MKKNIASTILYAAIFIAVGLLLMGRNAGIVNETLFHILVSWQMLLIMLGVDQFLRWKPVPGTVLSLIGVVFLIPEICSVEPWNFIAFWPAIFIIIGVAILLKLLKKPHSCHRSCNQTTNSEGYIESENSFSNVNIKAVAAPLKGGRVRNSFGNTVVDLRLSTLDINQVVIDVDCSFGHIEFKVPPTWSVRSTMAVNLAGFSDLRTGPAVEMDRLSSYGISKLIDDLNCRNS